MPWPCIQRIRHAEQELRLQCAHNEAPGHQRQSICCDCSSAQPLSFPHLDNAVHGLMSGSKLRLVILDIRSISAPLQTFTPGADPAAAKRVQGTSRAPVSASCPRTWLTGTAALRVPIRGHLWTCAAVAGLPCCPAACLRRRQVLYSAARPAAMAATTVGCCCCGPRQLHLHVARRRGVPRRNAPAGWASYTQHARWYTGPHEHLGPVPVLAAAAVAVYHRCLLLRRC
jgi:hypothetical protein